MEILTINPVVLALVPVVIGLTSVVKLYVENKWAPLISLGFSISLTMIATGTLLDGLIPGIVVGLMASGLYSGVKATVK